MRIYLFDKFSYRHWVESEAVDIVRGSAQMCPECGRAVSMLSWEAPRRMKLIGKGYPDYIPWYAGEGIVVSERFKKVYLDSGLKGIAEFNEIEVVNARQNCPVYYDARIKHSGAKVDYSRSYISGQPQNYSCPVCKPSGKTIDIVKRITLNLDAWNGEDIFRIYEFGQTCFATQNFVNVCTRKGLRDFRFVESTQYKSGIAEQI